MSAFFLSQIPVVRPAGIIAQRVHLGVGGGAAYLDRLTIADHLLTAFAYASLCYALFYGSALQVSELSHR